MDYKKTLNLPRTDFAMKANLPKREPAILEDWAKIDLCKLIKKNRKGSSKFILHDGPPYANGDIHIGHALNKILKDIIVKYKTMKGFDAPYVPGWDCHGLPVEHQLFKELGISKHEIDKVAFRKKAHKFAMKFVDIQRKQFERLGVFGDWKNPYLTLTSDYEEAILDSFQKLVEDGYVYRGLKPINWCIKCETALAEAEIEYENHTSPSTYVKFKLENNNIFKQDTYLVIWTTTPWTLAANVAVALHPDFLYAHYKTEKGDLIIAETREEILSSMDIKNIKKIGTFKGKDLEGMSYEHPLVLRKGKVVLADYVSNAEGTGCVHTAPGHGVEDYQTGLKYKLDIVMPVDTKGKFNETAGAELAGMHVFKANKKILEILKEKELLLLSEQLEHSYPHCWRCKKPAIVRATKQWFINVDHNELRKKTLLAIEDVNWIPEIGKSRISGMVNNRPDWCLSRQRYWGVPIPAFYCNGCEHELLDARIIEHVKKMVEKNGSDVWFMKEAKELLPKGFKCPECKKGDFAKEEDILDVWFDSGVSHHAVLKKRKELTFPSDLYLEGSDQHRGWFQTALLTSMGMSGAKPFKSVLTHGFVVDGDGKKMSKSLGNVISPQEVINKYGTDILRLWVASSNYSDDIRISDQVLARAAEAYRKIRNTIKFILGNLYDFDPGGDTVEYSSRLEIDRWAISKAHTILKKINAFYENFEFYKIYRVLYNFCITELSSFYLDILKDRLYTSGRESNARRSAQSSLYEILLILEKLIAPILVFTAEDAWKNTKLKESVESVHLSEWPAIKDDLIDTDLEERWDKLINIRIYLMKEIEKKRTEGEVGSSLEARVDLAIKDNELFSFLNRYKEELPTIFIVSEVKLTRVEEVPKEFRQDEGLGGMGMLVGKAGGQKCSRCWNYSRTVGSNEAHSSLCEKCVSVVDKL